MSELNEREFLMLKYLAEGKRREDAAALVGVNVRNGRTILCRAVEKVGAETVTHACVILARQGKFDAKG